MSRSAEVTCYGVRRLSPFRGTLQLVKSADGRAVSSDGVNWQLQLWRQHRVPQWGGLGQPQVRWGYVVIGVWSRDLGLDHFPLDPASDFADIERASQRLLAELQRYHDQVPFPPADTFALWLLDRDSEPLALLVSSRDHEGCARVTEARFMATVPSDRSFVSETLSQDSHYARELQRGSHYHRDAIVSLVMAAAGKPAIAQWFHRQADGSGTGLGGVRVPSVLRGRRLASPHFRELPLRERWRDTRAERLVHDFHAWQAPRLLTLSLSPAGRARWEPFACRQSETLEQLHRLYPALIDRGRVHAALVEAVIRRSAGAAR